MYLSKVSAIRFCFESPRDDNPLVIIRTRCKREEDDVGPIGQCSAIAQNSHCLDSRVACDHAHPRNSRKIQMASVDHDTRQLAASYFRKELGRR